MKDQLKPSLKGSCTGLSPHGRRAPVDGQAPPERPPSSSSCSTSSGLPGHGLKMSQRKEASSYAALTSGSWMERSNIRATGSPVLEPEERPCAGIAGHLPLPPLPPPIESVQNSPCEERGRPLAAGSSYQSAKECQPVSRLAQDLSPGWQGDFPDGEPNICWEEEEELLQNASPTDSAPLLLDPTKAVVR